MNTLAMTVDSDRPEFNYHLLRHALNRYSRNLAQLQANEYQEVYRSAQRSFELESLVLESDEAQKLVISSRQIDAALASIRERYQSDSEFHADLQINGLDETTLRDALYRELVFDGVMQRVGSRAVEVNELDAQIFYEMHHERFARPETRRARHILITINDEFAENTRPQALARIQSIAQKLGQRGHRFARFARQYSECPTAMEGGELGEITRGKLFPELDAQLFALSQGEIGPVVESEVGYHLLWCEKIQPSKRIAFSQARAQIDQILLERRRRNCQKHWLSGLRQSATGWESGDE
jgi:peptidyl-prolyl cis-trans isomerase C